MMSEARQPRFGIIEPGLVREPLRETFGDYPSMLKTLLSEHFTGNQFDTFSIVNGEALPEPTAYDGFVVMGSAHGVKDGLPWFDALCEWIGNVVDQRVPLVGICFGHQAIAQALGGDVGRSSSGWCVGLQRYSVAGQSDGQSALIAHAFHQDQVVESPPGADTVMSTPLCPHAGF
ncbi:MAG: type 1 glutamine amidotransferase, partial [Lysobacterales bacterium]